MSRLAVEATELEAICRALRDQADELADQAAIVLRCAFDGALAEAAMLAPSETAAAEAQILAAATSAGALVAELQAFALATAAGAELYERADEMLADAAKALDTVQRLLGAATDAVVDWTYKTAYPGLMDGLLHIGVALVAGPTASHEEAAAGLLALAEAFGFKDRDQTHDPLKTNEAFGAGEAVVLGRLMDYEQTAYNNGKPQVVLTTVKGPDGKLRHIVNIPGTDPGGLAGVTGLVSDFSTMDDTMATTESQRSELVQEVVAVMREAGIGPGDEVVLSGHSLGGMAAASIASDEALVREFGIKGIVTQGSPIAHYPVRDNVNVLAFEHRQDAIVHLDGASNPHRWTTIVRNDPEGSWNPLDAHNSDVHYGKTMATAGSDPAVGRWLSSHGFDGTAESQQTSRLHFASGSRSW